MENVGSPSASDDGTPVQPISSSTPPVPSFPALLGTTVSGLSSSTADVEITPQVAGCGLSSSMAEVQSTPSTSQFAGSGLPSSLSMSGGGLSSSTVDGESAPSTSQVAGSGLSSFTQPQADEAAVSSVSNPEEFGPMQSHVIKAEAGEEKDLKLESEINYLVLKRKLVKFTIKQINSFISARSVVGIGSWGTVYEGMIEGLSGLSSDLNGERIAVKVGNYFCKEEEFCNDENYIQWKTEIMILSDIKHEGVIKLFGVCRTNRGLYLVYPFYERGDLQKSIEVLDWERALNVIVKVAEALRVLHRGQVVCRGLKPADILLDDNWNPVVTDFGLMKMFGDGLSVSQKFNQEDLLFSGHQDHVLHYDSYCLGFLMLQVLVKVKEAHFEVTGPKERGIMHFDIDSYSCRYSSEFVEQALKLNKQNSHVVHLDFLKTGKCTMIVARNLSELAFKCLAQGGVTRPTSEEVVKLLRMIVSLPAALGGSSSKSSK